MNTSQSLVGKVAVVTGGGGGIGSAISYRLAQAGMSVVITYNSGKARAEAVATALPGDAHIALHVPVDNRDKQSELAAVVAERYGRLDLLVNNAGVTRPVAHDDLDGLTDEVIDQIFSTNWRGTFASIRALKPLLVADEGGLVINISSVAGRTGIGSNVAYCASKAVWTA